MRSKNKNRPSNSINASSMADIAFLLLIFFLVTTTILLDEGIAVLLPPHDATASPKPISDKNILSVHLNAQNELLLENEPILLTQLKSKAKEFILNPAKLKTLPDNPKKAIISLQNDRSTQYDAYLQVYNELQAAYNELWNETALRQFGTKYESLPKNRQKQIRAAIPLVISEAEPTDYLAR